MRTLSSDPPTSMETISGHDSKPSGISNSIYIRRDSVKKEPAGFIYALSGPLRSRILTFSTVIEFVS